MLLGPLRGQAGEHSRSSEIERKEHLTHAWIDRYVSSLPSVGTQTSSDNMFSEQTMARIRDSLKIQLLP